MAKMCKVIRVVQAEWLAHTGASVLAVFQRLMAGSGQPAPARAVVGRHRLRRRPARGWPPSVATGAVCATSATAVRPS